MTIPQEEAAVRLPPFCFRLPAVFSPLLSAPPRGASFAALRPGLLSAIPTVPSANRPLRRTIRHRFRFPTRRTGKHPHAPTAFPSSRPTRFQPNASPKNSALTESGRISSPGPPTRNIRQEPPCPPRTRPPKIAGPARRIEGKALRKKDPPTGCPHPQTHDAPCRSLPPDRRPPRRKAPAEKVEAYFGILQKRLIFVPIRRYGDCLRKRFEGPKTGAA